LSYMKTTKIICEDHDIEVAYWSDPLKESLLTHDVSDVHNAQ